MSSVVSSQEEPLDRDSDGISDVREMFINMGKVLPWSGFPKEGKRELFNEGF